jgi:predicted membrane channel-forming protein YqfA (hemolysin III family)
MMTWIDKFILIVFYLTMLVISIWIFKHISQCLGIMVTFLTVLGAIYHNTLEDK